MEVQGYELQLMEYAMCMQGLATMGQIESGFLLLERAEAKGLLSRFDNEGYPMFHNLLQACRFVGDVKGISRVQAAIDRLGLIALAPVATAVVQGSLRQYQNGNVGEGVVDARQLWSKLRQRKPYKPQLEESLKLHAEKKALAMLLSNNVEDELSISINFNACMDCHEFFKISSQMLGRRIQLRQPQMTHTFSAGNCSCNDQWSWEARLTPEIRRAASQKEKTVVKKRCWKRCENGAETVRKRPTLMQVWDRDCDSFYWFCLTAALFRSPFQP